jgi:hypothetical protein
MSCQQAAGPVGSPAGRGADPIPVPFDREYLCHRWQSNANVAQSGTPDQQGQVLGFSTPGMGALIGVQVNGGR